MKKLKLNLNKFLSKFNKVNKVEFSSLQAEKLIGYLSHKYPIDNSALKIEIIKIVKINDNFFYEDNVGQVYPKYSIFIHTNQITELNKVVNQAVDDYNMNNNQIESFYDNLFSEEF